MHDAFIATLFGSLGAVAVTPFVARVILQRRDRNRV
jgi:hypothetical protein